MRRIRSADWTDVPFVASGPALNCPPGRVAAGSVEVVVVAAVAEDHPGARADAADSIRTIDATSVADGAIMLGTVPAGVEDARDPEAAVPVRVRASCAPAVAATAAAVAAAGTVSVSVNASATAIVAPAPRRPSRRPLAEKAEAEGIGR